MAENWVLTDLYGYQYCELHDQHYINYCCGCALFMPPIGEKIMDIKEIKKLVAEYERQSGFEATNFRQLDSTNDPEAVYDALKLDINWHTDHVQEVVAVLEKAQNIAFMSY
jgi:hypothetical protein